METKTYLIDMDYLNVPSSTFKLNIDKNKHGIFDSIIVRLKDVKFSDATNFKINNYTLFQANTSLNYIGGVNLVFSNGKIKKHLSAKADNNYFLDVNFIEDNFAFETLILNTDGFFTIDKIDVYGTLKN